MNKYKIGLMIIALFGCFCLGILAHEVRHTFQREYTDLCVSNGKPFAYVYNRNTIYYQTPEQYQEDEILPTFWCFFVWITSSIFVIKGFNKSK